MAGERARFPTSDCATSRLFNGAPFYCVVLFVSAADRSAPMRLEGDGEDVAKATFVASDTVVDDGTNLV
jgi:hypothetical protein